MKKDTMIFISMMTVGIIFVAGIMADNIYTTIKPRPQMPVIDIAQLLKTFQKADLSPVEARHYKILKRY